MFEPRCALAVCSCGMRPRGDAERGSVEVDKEYTTRQSADDRAGTYVFIVVRVILATFTPPPGRC